MSQTPREIWERQTKKQQEQILKELITIFQGIINEYIRIKTPHHLAIKAIIYIRQSTLHQTIA
jgi:hypothetical protein